MNSDKHLIYGFVDGQGKVFYVGKTKSLKDRIRAHRYEVERGNRLYKYNKLRKVMRETGKRLRDLIKVIEDGILENDVDSKEVYYIKKLRLDGYKLTNLTDGGEGGINTNPESIERVRLAHLGTHHSEETKRKMSEARRGIKFSDEHKHKLSIARQKRITTSETRLKMHLSAKGKINTGLFKVTDRNGNEFITHEGLTKFCEDHNLDNKQMSAVACGKRKQHRGWKAVKMEKSNEANYQINPRHGSVQNDHATGGLPPIS